MSTRAWKCTKGAWGLLPPVIPSGQCHHMTFAMSNDFATTEYFSLIFSRLFLYRVDFFLYWYIYYLLLLGIIISFAVRWASDNAFHCKLRGPWSESYIGISWISLGGRNRSPWLHLTKVWISTLRGRCLCTFDIPGRCLLTAHKTRSEIKPKDQGKFMSNGGWTTE